MDPFLVYDDFQNLHLIVQSHLQEIAKLSKEKKVKKIKQTFQHQKTFNNDSAQGMAGIVTIEVPENLRTADNNTDAKFPLVFKLSLEINRVAEHEHTVLHTLNRIRKFCPNFVGTLGLLPGYVSRTFYEEEDVRKVDKNIFDVKENSIPLNYLLLEYVSDLDFDHFIKRADKLTVTGILLGVLSAIQIAQNKCKFTHYDLHVGNIFMRKVEENSYFAYVINQEVILYPTCGWYPVMIDMGSSHVEELEKFPTRSFIGTYHLGQQTTQYDTLADVHHFVLHTLSLLEKEEKQPDHFCRHFRLLAGRLMHMFRNCKLWRYKGWKHLPCNLFYSFNKAILDSKASLCGFYRKAKINIVESLVLGVELPWKALSISELKAKLAFYYPSVTCENEEDTLSHLLKGGMEDVCHLLNVLDRDPLIKTGIVIIYILRAISEIVYWWWQKNPQFESSISTFETPKELIHQFKLSIQNLYPQLSVKLDVHATFRGIFVIRQVLRHMLSGFHDINMTTIDSWYEATEVKKPMDVLKFIKQNSAIPYYFTDNTPIYVWDSDKETHHKIRFEQLKLHKDASKREIYEAIRSL